LRQARKRLADWGLANFEILDQFLMRESLTRHDFMLQNRLFDFRVGDLGKTKVFQLGPPLQDTNRDLC
jgi:hypothetical protein